MSDLTEFLLARIAEDERMARAAAPGPWLHTEDGYIEGAEVERGLLPNGLPLRQPTAITDTESGTLPPDVNTAEHIARHDPVHVLAECEAKRRIIELHNTDHDCPQAEHENINHYAHVWPGEDCLTLQLLAQPYADHPDFDPAWRL